MNRQSFELRKNNCSLVIKTCNGYVLVAYLRQMQQTQTAMMHDDAGCGWLWA